MSMPSFSHTVEIARSREEVFPWLLEADKVPQWTSDLERYEVLTPLGPGARVRQVLSVAGGLTLDVEVTDYSPPHGAATRFETNGVKLSSAYSLASNGGGTRLTQTLDAKAGGLTARMLIPVVQGRLEKKLAGDLDRLRELLGR
jgi:uncharacterized protein YndB with AHSA1/START domain